MRIPPSLKWLTSEELDGPRTETMGSDVSRVYDLFTMLARRLPSSPLNVYDDWASQADSRLSTPSWTCLQEIAHREYNRRIRGRKLAVMTGEGGF